MGEGGREGMSCEFRQAVYSIHFGNFMTECAITDIHKYIVHTCTYTYTHNIVSYL